MIGSEHIKRLIADAESDCIERTMSTSNTDKFAEAICAFANDLPNHKTPGYLILGVEDNGKQNLGWTPEPTPRWEWNERAGSWDVKSDSLSEKSDSSNEKSDSLREKSYSLMDETTASIIEFCSTPRTLPEIMSEFGFKERHNFKKRYIDPLLYVFLKQTEPDKPTSPKQKYVTIKKEEKQ